MKYARLGLYDFNRHLKPLELQVLIGYSLIKPQYSIMQCGETFFSLKSED